MSTGPDRDADSAEDAFLPDSMIWLDIVLGNADWEPWSTAALTRSASIGKVVVNQTVFAEISGAFELLEDVDGLLRDRGVTREDIPWEAAFLAGRAFRAYRRRGGARTSTLSDFLIGAHALVRGYTLITRDARRYRTYFPALRVIAPDS